MEGRWSGFRARAWADDSAGGKTDEEGSYTVINSQHRSQGPSKHDKRLFQEKWCLGPLSPRRAVRTSTLNLIAPGMPHVTKPCQTIPHTTEAEHNRCTAYVGYKLCRSLCQKISNTVVAEREARGHNLLD